MTEPHERLSAESTRAAAQQIEQLTLEISQRQREIFKLRAACQHDYQPSDPTWLSASSPECKLCGDRRFGWWCEESPTKECDYSKPSGRGYNTDDCRYCHQPEERK